MKLKKKLKAWLEADLITPAQQQKIIAFENNQVKPALMGILLSLSVFCIGVGLISLIAANWEAISNPVKMVAMFLLLAGTGAAVFKAYLQHKNTAGEVWLLVYALLILGAIGLTGQVFQLQTIGLRAYLFWSFLTLPLLVLTRKMILPIIWVPAFLFSMLDELSRTDWFNSLIHYFDNSLPYGAVIMILIIYVVIYSLLNFLLTNRNPAIVKAWNFWLIFNLVSQVFFMDFFSDALFGMYFGSYAPNTVYNWGAVAILIFATVSTAWFNFRFNGKSCLATDIIATILLFALILGALPEEKIAHQLFGLFLTLSCLSWVMFYGWRRQNIRLLNLASGLVALRIFIVYLQVFGTLMTTGLGMIISGVVLLIIIKIWQLLMKKLKQQKGL